MKLKFASLLLALYTLTHCSSASKEYFLLPSISRGVPIQSYPATSGIGVGPVNLASYLDRPHVVFETTPNQLYVSENQRWAGQLDDNICRVLSQELAHHMKSSSIRTYPWNSDKGLGRQVSIQIQRFHGTSEGEVSLEAEYTIYRLPSQEVQKTKRWSGSEALSRDGFPAMVEAQGKLLSRFAEDIAASLR